jgi:hypothetical protein
MAKSIPQGNGLEKARVDSQVGCKVTHHTKTHMLHAGQPLVHLLLETKAEWRNEMVSVSG